MITKLVKPHKAQGMIEFALVLPLLLLVMLALIEFGRLIFIYSAVFTASREAARYGAAAGNIGGYIAHYQDCAGMRAAARRIGNLVGIQDSNIIITYDDGNGNPLGTCPVGGLGPATITLGNRVIVTVTAQYQPILPLVRLPSFPITSRTARTVLKDIAIRGTPAAPPGTATVCFDPSGPQVVSEGNSVRVWARLSSPTSADVTVPFTLSGRASDGTDYTLMPAGSVFIPAGSPEGEIQVQTIQDAIYEGDEDIVLQMGDPTNARRCTTAGETATVTIEDDDPMPTVSFTTAGQSRLESSGSTFATLQLSAMAGVDVTVPFSVEPISSTATLDSDYALNTSSPVVIPAGQLARNINLTVINDTLDEPDETAVLRLGTPTNALLGAITSHTLTIEDDDLPPTVAFTWDRQQVTEDVGTIGIQVRLSAPSGLSITVPYTLDGSATQNQDYTIQASPLVITPGLSVASIPLTIMPDYLLDPDETITVTMGAPINAFLGSPSVHTVVIAENMPTPSVYFAPASQSAAESISSMVIAVRLTSAYNQTVTVPFTVGGTARQGVDYTISPSPVVIPPGGAEALITINILNDTVDENDETVSLTMGTPVNALPGEPSQAEATIIDDDAPPQVYFGSTSQSGNEAVGVMSVSVNLSAISGKDVMVPFTASGTATEGADYTLSPSGMVTIPAGSLNATISIQVINDDSQGGTNIGEGDETIILTLGAPVNATLGSPTVHTATITAWVCPTAPSNPYFGSGSDSKKLSWDIQFAGTGTLNLLEVTIYWPTQGSSNVTGITFGGAPIGASYYYPSSSGYLDVLNPSPLWSGTFSSRQMIFLFSNSPDLRYGNIVVSARFEHCLPFSKRISN